MLTTRPAKRDKAGFLEMPFDVLDDGERIGGLMYNRKTFEGAFTLGGKSYIIECLADAAQQTALSRFLKSGRTSPSPCVLRDASGRALGSAERVKPGFAVSYGEERFVLRWPRAFSQRYPLYREGMDDALGWVGQERFFTKTMHMRVPGEFDAALQVFLLVLALNLTMEQLAESTS